MRACTLGSAFKRPLPGRAPAAWARISVCARIYDSSYGTHPWRTFGAGEPGPENRREGRGENDACLDPASKNEGKSVFWKRSTVSATKRKRGERRSVRRRHNSQITLRCLSTPVF